MIKKFKQIIENILSNALWEVIRTVLYVFVSTLFILNIKDVYVMILIIILSIISIVILAKKNDYVNFKYSYRSKKITFEYNEDYTVFTSEIDGTSNSDKLMEAYWRYLWHKDKKIEIDLSPKEMKIIEVKTTDYKRYAIRLDKEYNNGDKFSYTIKAKLHGDVLFPEYATTIVAPTTILYLSVKIPLKYVNSKDIYCITSPSPPEVGIIKSEKKTLNDFGEYTWRIKRPRLSYEYSISWDKKDSKKDILSETGEVI